MIELPVAGRRSRSIPRRCDATRRLPRKRLAPHAVAGVRFPSEVARCLRGRRTHSDAELSEVADREAAAVREAPSENPMESRPRMPRSSPTPAIEQRRLAPSRSRCPQVELRSDADRRRKSATPVTPCADLHSRSQLAVDLNVPTTRSAANARPRHRHHLAYRSAVPRSFHRLRWHDAHTEHTLSPAARKCCTRCASTP